MREIQVQDRDGELIEELLLTHKVVEMRDVDSLLRSREASIHRAENKETNDQFASGETSQVTGVPVALDLGVSQESIGRMKPSTEESTVPRHLDLNSEACIPPDKLPICGLSECFDNHKKDFIFKKHEHDCERTQKCLAFGRIDLDLNAEDASSSVNQDPLEPFRSRGQLKSRDVSECGSTTGPLEQKDPLRIWMEMKQNGFLSSSHGGLSFQNGLTSSSHGGILGPKTRKRKTKNDILKRKMELAKKEQVDRFTKVAAPSGLLNGLNPGIINHVRNKKQVHSIIEALVRTEELHSSVESKQAGYAKCGIKKTSDVSGSGYYPVSFSQGYSSSISISVSKQKRGYTSIVDGNYSAVDRMCSRSFISHSTAVSEDDMLMLKLSSTKASEVPSTFFNDELAYMTNVSSLSIRAATVASQWLELLHQDIKGRLSALRRSKKRAQDVITTELPFLVSKEFSHQENESTVIKNSSDVLSSNTNAAMHQARWSTLFSQMDKALIEEEKQLASWLNQVKEMQLHCDQGLQHTHWNANFGHQQQGRSEIFAGSGKADSSERELAIMAAAACIYSTCNFLMSKENVSCF